ncbi:hypothetical protein O6268_23585, partial [Salmonella enterica subsp. enterica]
AKKTEKVVKVQKSSAKSSKSAKAGNASKRSTVARTSSRKVIVSKNGKRKVILVQRQAAPVRAAYTPPSRPSLGEALGLRDTDDALSLRSS